MLLAGVSLKFTHVLYRIVLLVVLTLIALWFGLDTAKEPRRFISVLGMLVYVGISWAFSRHRRKVSYRVFNLPTFSQRTTVKLFPKDFSVLLSKAAAAILESDVEKNQEKAERIR